MRNARIQCKLGMFPFFSFFWKKNISNNILQNASKIKLAGKLIKRNFILKYDNNAKILTKQENIVYRKHKKTF